MTSRSTPYRRRVLGRGRGGFKVTNRSTSGADQRVAVPEVPNISTPQRPETRASAVPIAQQGVMPMAPTFGNRYETDPRVGHQTPAGGLWNEAAASDDPLHRWLGNLFGGDAEGQGLDTSINPSGPSTAPSGYRTAGQRFADDARALEAETGNYGYVDWFTNDKDQRWGGNVETGSGSSAGENEVVLTPEEMRKRKITSNDTSADERMVGRVGRELEQNLAPSSEEIQSAVDSSVADFMVEKAMLEAQRDQALADGLEGEADRFNDQISQQEKLIQKMKDEIALTDDIEGWYRRRIQGPYQKAMAAAEAINYEKTLAVQSKYRNEEAQMLAETEQRLNGVLGDIGFTPEQIESFQGERAMDNEVTAAQSALLEASGVREGELNWEKKLKSAMAEEEWMRSNRESSGRQMIVAEQNRKGIAEAEDRIGELDKLKQKAMDRVRRAVDREFQGAKFPELDEFRGAALDQMRTQLYGDLPPEQQAWFDNAIDAFIASGKPFTQRNLEDMVMNGQIEVAESATLDALWRQLNEQARDAGVPFPDDIYEREAREILSGAFDAEDRAIIKGMVDTHTAATEEHRRYTEERATKNYSNAENRSSQNIADAKAGEGVYGMRAKMVTEMVPVIQGLWGVGSGGRVTAIQGQNYFRPLQSEAETRASGRSMNSDHMTAGALDLFLDVNDPKDVAYYRNVMVPQLRKWQDQGLISSWVGLGANTAHNDHVHVSFALGSMNDQGFSPEQVDSGGGPDFTENVDQGLRGPIGI